ncbi:phosphatidylglycerol lysyltransferase domain-containing protein [Kitasatospora sp. NBC_01287]|uniref:phosphatidylglycerol lysyltransferase domain-containing protein n=1 Tax=Kitasatospora sp. NBC_01287 TaxID=2903573 RepID=UPI002258D9AA|nr:phosphatidylglycerol lysyltransferase domain-containing protein [Kitasatospora sp. NBC_01287]MCX4747376.1 phosphatidylglycerol lysyltransferase domain-containing protein [Kitasatospora sp. NBC_01287]
MSVPVSTEPSPAAPEQPRRRGLQTLRSQAAAVPRAWLPGAVGYACLLIGLVDIASAIFPKLRKTRMHTWAGQLPGTTTTLATAGTLLIGILLVLLAHALRRRKRRAWRMVCVLLPAGAALHILRWHQVGPAVVSLVVLAVLLVHRREFFAKADPRTRWRALLNLVVMGAISLGLGFLIVSTHPRREMGSPSLFARVHETVWGLFGMDGPITYHPDRIGDVVGYSLAGLGLLTAFSTAYLLLRPEKPEPELTADEEVKVRALLARHGERDSLGYFALRRDKSVLFSPTGKAAISYRVISGVMLASGDPVGDVEAWPGAIKVFMAQAREHAWVPAVVGCSEVGGEVWTREAGLDALELGDEAIVDATTFSMAGRAMRNVRQMVKRIERNGYSCQVRRVSDLTLAEKVRIADAAARWRGTDTERGFSMALGRFGDPADDDCVVVTAHKAPEEGESGAAADDLKAVLHFVPWGPDGISLELMRRDRAADPGLNELLIVAALQAVPALGVRRVSLNFAMFRSALARGERIGAGPVLRAWRGLLVFLSRWFQIESLYKFNAKFQPEWEPRFMVYPSTRDLPRIGFAVMQAEAFITLGMPKFGRKRQRQGLMPTPAGESGTIVPAA